MKIAYIDCETTGRDPQKHHIWQLAMIIEIDGEIQEELNLKVNPGSKALDGMSQEVIDKTHIDLAAVEHYPISAEGFKQFETILDGYINRFDKTDKLHFVGWNAGFDSDFVRAWFKQNGNNYYGSWFWVPTLDAMAITGLALAPERSKLPNFQLMTVAEHLGIEINATEAHDALYDIQVTRDVWKRITNG